jgi:pimeloyl-ACP methyl ester carboxylesterase
MRAPVPASRGSLPTPSNHLNPARALSWVHSCRVAEQEDRRGTRMRLTVPTLLVWGDYDPLGGVEVAQATARLISKAQLEVLPAGHVPWLTRTLCPNSCPGSSSRVAMDGLGIQR